jgi:hypothetical protein
VSEDETSGSDTDVSTKSDNGSTQSKSSSSKAPKTAPADGVNVEGVSAKELKELERKERRRDAVRQCRRRKREAAMKLEAQFKFERERQARLMTELEKKSLGHVPPTTMPNPLVSEVELVRLLQTQARGQKGVSEYVSQLLAQLNRMREQSALQHTLQCQQQPLVGVPPMGRVDSATHPTMMEEMLLRRSIEAAAAQAARRATMPSPAQLGPMAALIAAAEQEERRTVSPPVNNFATPSFISPTSRIPEDPPRLLKKQKLDSNLTEEEKELQRKERKREAVRRCRQRKRLQQERLAQETMRIVHQNDKLQSSLLLNGMMNVANPLPSWRC